MGSGPECRIVRPGKGYQGKQGLSYGAGISAESAGATGLCLHTLVVAPGGRAKAHLHEHHESAIYMLEGEGEMWWGEGLTHHEYVEAGDFVYIPAGVPHLPANRSATVPMRAVIDRPQRPGERGAAAGAGRTRRSAAYPSAITRQLTASTRTTGVITSRSGRLREAAFITTPRPKNAVRIHIHGPASPGCATARHTSHAMTA
jgi:uncharacterized RmlC-like cupin family protein